MAKKTLDQILRCEKRFGTYTVLGEGDPHPKSRLVVCRCDCGVERVVAANKLTSGRSTCCKACAAKSAKRVTNLRHGLSGSPEYLAYTAMKARCYRPSTESYPRYGGRGIRVCDRWLTGFETFYADMGPRPDGMSLDRIDNDGDYEPGNCRWASPEDQSGNRRVTLRLEEHGGEGATAKAARRAGIKAATLAYRLRSGASLEQALSKPVANKKPRHEVFGERLLTSEIVDRYGIDKQVFNYRLRVKKMTAEEAIRMG